MLRKFLQSFVRRVEFSLSAQIAGILQLSQTCKEAPKMANVYSSVESANAATLNDASIRTIVVRWKSPARLVAVTIPNDAFVTMRTEVPAAYIPLIEATLEDTAKGIIKRFIESHSLSPTTIPDGAFTSAALIEAATISHTDWLTKEELTTLWQASTTRSKLVTDPRYGSSKEYRVAVNYFSELVIKFAGKTSQFKPVELDKVLAKLDDADLQSELGAFIVRRVEALKNKPAASEIDLDLI